jgi:hypothetical protein
MEFKELIDLIESAEMEPRSYTGRGMGNRVCLGIVSDNSLDIPLTLVQCYLENCPTDSSSIQEAMDLCEQLKDSKFDSMGRGEIVYWPGIKWQDLDEEMPDLEQFITPEMLEEYRIKNS